MSCDNGGISFDTNDGTGCISYPDILMQDGYRSICLKASKKNVLSYILSGDDD